MKKHLILAALLIQTISTVSMAETILNCTPGTALAGQISNIKISNDEGDLNVKYTYSAFASMFVGSEISSPIIRVEGNGNSKKYILSEGEDGEVVSSIEADLNTKKASFVFDYPSYASESLDCK